MIYCLLHYYRPQPHSKNTRTLWIWIVEKNEKRQQQTADIFFRAARTRLRLEMKQIGEKWSGFQFVFGLFSRSIYVLFVHRFGIDGRQR